MTDQGANFRSVLAIAPTESVADLVRNLQEGSYDYIAHLNEHGETWARPVDTDLSGTLQQVAETSAATALVTMDVHRVQSRPTASVPSVDRGIQLLELLSEQLGEKQQTLCLIEHGIPVQIFGIATASAHIAVPNNDHGDDPLLWITDMPNDRTLFDQRVLLAGSTPILRTRLGFDSLTNGSVLTLPRSKFQDRKVEFDLTGRNVKLREIGANASDSAHDQYHLRSRPIDANGGDSFEVQLIPEQAGKQASVRIRLYFVSDGEIYQEVGSAPVNNSYVSLDFHVLEASAPTSNEQAATNQVAEAAGVADAVVQTAVPFDPPAAVEWIRWDASSAETRVAFDRDGQTLSHLIHADEGTLSGEYRQILQELWKLGGAHQVSPTNPLHANDTGPTNLLRFAQLGSQLHALVYGSSATAHRDFLASEQGKHIAQLGRNARTRRLRITDEKHGLPWALFYDHGYADGDTYPETIDDVDIEGFWGYRFRIDHDVRRQDRNAWQPRYSELTAGDLAVTSFVNPTVVGDDTKHELNQKLVAMNESFLDNLGATVTRPSTGFRESPTNSPSAHGPFSGCAAAGEVIHEIATNVAVVASSVSPSTRRSFWKEDIPHACSVVQRPDTATPKG